MNACTIVARNYLAFARVLARSFRAQHPEDSFFVLVVDDDERRVDEACEPFRVLRPEDLGLARSTFRQMAIIYDVTEMSTALKPLLLSYLLEMSSTTAMYLDPDIWVHAELSDVNKLAQEHGIVLTPHRTVPMISDDRTPSEQDILASGAFNLGFIALGPATSDFLGWWTEHLRLDAIRDVENDLFTDQRWIDLVPGYFKHHILGDEACNVAYWNLDSRRLTWTGSQYEVNGAPLRFFHFSGFDPDRPHVLTMHHAESPRIVLSREPTLARLCEEYSHLVREARDALTAGSYAYDTLANGLRVDRFMRRAYRAALLRSPVGESPVLPDPFSREADKFIKWLNEPIGGQSHTHVFRGRGQVSRYLHQLYLEHPHLYSRFPSVPGRDAGAFLEWIADAGRYRFNVAQELLPAKEGARQIVATQSTAQGEGINIAGYFRAEDGVGEAGRSVAAAVAAAGIPYATLVYDDTVKRQEHPFSTRDEEEPTYETNLLCVNADQVPHFAEWAGREFFEARRTIGLWHWEVEQFPASYMHAFEYVDEVWTASEFARLAVSKIAPCPVFTFPLPITASPAVDASSLELGEANRFGFLFMFDFLSVFERKNPMALVEAFRLAFEPDEGPILVIKSTNGNLRLHHLELLRSAVAGRSDIKLIDRYMPVHERQQLTASCDCYVSLHRSEGFGLTLAEAMSLGKPVIATGYSGNLEYMSETNSYLVPYTLVPIGEGCEPYPAQARWAAPDIKEAARFMRQVYEEPADAVERAALGRTNVLELLKPGARAEFIRERFAANRLLRSRTVVRGFDTVPRRHRSMLRLAARVAVRATAKPASAVSHPSPKWRRSAAFIRRVCYRPYMALLRMSGGFDKPTRHRRASETGR